MLKNVDLDKWIVYPFFFVCLIIGIVWGILFGYGGYRPDGNR